MKQTIEHAIVLIPSLEPDRRLPAYIKKLREYGFTRIVIVDDGSGSCYQDIYKELEESGCTVIHHSVNRGKGLALKTGYDYIRGIISDYTCIVTADSDGQHAPEDVYRLAVETKDHPEALILGVRDFKKAGIPVKSLIGNCVTSGIFGVLYGKYLPDTQSGLRAFGTELADRMLGIKGERFEYETQVLITCIQSGIPVLTLPIQTIYEDENRGTHFKAVRDSLKIIGILGADFMKFLSSSAVCSFVDIGIAWALLDWLKPYMEGNNLLRIMIATAFARSVSTAGNYLLNKNMVFKDKQATGHSLFRYLSLCLFNILMSAAGVYILHAFLGYNEKTAKLLCDGGLFLLGYQIQQRWVFSWKVRCVLNKEEKKRNLLFIITIVLMTIYLGWRIIFTLPLHEGILNLIFGILLIASETITVFSTFELFYQKMQMNKFHLECPEIPDESYPDVDIFIVTHNEPADLLYKTVNACTFMDYPDKNKVHIFICDDGNRKEIAELAGQLGVSYLGVKGNKDAKSGNLNNALSKTSSPLIATFDTDMIPQHTFLMKTVPYFLLTRFIKEDGKWRLKKEEEINKNFRLGLIQTPQSFYNPDLFQFNLYAEENIPNEQDFFSREVNTMRNSSNAIAYTGSNTVILREAMEEIGGFPIKTITEDFETSIRLQKAGYITYATDEVQAAGLTTTTIKSMIKQRVRWGRGIIQSLQNTHAIITPRLPLLARLTYLNTFLYWCSFFNRLIFIISPILAALFDFRIVKGHFWDVIVFWLPSYFFYSMSMRYLSGNVRSQRWSQIIDTIFMPYLIVPIFLEVFHIHQRKFKVTNKMKEGSGMESAVFAVPHVILLALSAGAIVRLVHGKYGWALFYNSIILFWIVYNMVSLFYALFFMLGRRSYRSSERIRAEENIIIQYNGFNHEAKTADVSENGLAFWSEKPIYLPDNNTVTFVITTNYYKAILEGNIVYVKEQDSGWRYSAAIRPVDDENKRQYMQIIYDRNHSLPKQMDLWITAYDDMLRNIIKRLKQPLSDKRKMPRIPVERQITFTNGATCRLIDFNYKYFSVSGFNTNGSQADKFIYFTDSGIRLVLKRTRIYIRHSSQELLSVVNLIELIRKNRINQILVDITNKNGKEG